jgi:hypothetical protein
MVFDRSSALPGGVWQYRSRSTQFTAGAHQDIECHWSDLLTGNQFGDLSPTTLPLFLRRPSGSAPWEMNAEILVRMRNLTRGAPHLLAGE